MMEKDFEFPTILPEVVGKEYAGHWQEDLPEDEYHADASAVSSSGVRTYLRSPAHFFHSHVIGIGKKPTKAMKFGTLAHKAQLEAEYLKNNFLCVPDFGNCTLKENKANRNAWLDQRGLYWDTKQQEFLTKDGGPMPFMLVTEKDAIRIEGMVKAILEHPFAKSLLLDGVCEASGYFREPMSGLKCRFRPDFISHSLKTLVDYKTCNDASFRAFQRAAFGRGYPIQMGFYDEGVYQLHGWRPEQIVLLAQESEPPYCVVCYVVDEGALSYGQEKMKKACAGIAECIQKGHWPGYSEGIENLSLPPWAMEEAGYGI